MIDLGPLGAVRTDILGPARTAEARLQSSGCSAWSAARRAPLAPGLTAPVTIVNGGARGDADPRSALVRTEAELRLSEAPATASCARPSPGGSPQAGEAVRRPRASPRPARRGGGAAQPLLTAGNRPAAQKNSRC